MFLKQYDFRGFYAQDQFDISLFDFIQAALYKSLAEYFRNYEFIG